MNQNIMETLAEMKPFEGEVIDMPLRSSVTAHEMQSLNLPSPLVSKSVSVDL